MDMEDLRDFLGCYFSKVSLRGTLQVDNHSYTGTLSLD